MSNVNNDFLIITRKLVKRGWTDIEPKVAAGFASGAFAGIAITILSSYIPLSDAAKQWIPYIVAIIGSYVVPSSGLSITSKNDGEGTTETTTTGSTVTTATAGIPIQAPAPYVPPTPVQASAQSFLANLGNQTAPQTDNGTSSNAATEIIPPALPAPLQAPWS